MRQGAKDLGLRAGPEHGGDLADAEDLRSRLTGEAADPDASWLDLSTGINPHAYPLAEIADAAWRALPSRRDLARLLAAARAAYGVPEALDLVAAPGSEALIHLLPTLLEPGRLALFAPTYGEHERAWGQAGHEVHAVSALDEALEIGGHVVLVHPNNPDGRLFDADEIAALGAAVAASASWLVIDEAFADLVPEQSALAHGGHERLVVLRSFGKFFGLAGLRLGFAAAPAELAAQIRARLGAWAVSGPALAIAEAALGDAGWQQEMRVRLAREAAALNRILIAGGLEILGGTSLYHLAAHERAAGLFGHLLKHRVYVRRFAADPRRLRFGLPGSEQGARRLGEVLQSFAGAGR